ncbi:polyphosphate polymerase domain-containing protein [Clostridium sp. DL1XJH146]
MINTSKKLRHEHKYLLDYGTYLQIRNNLQKLMKLDEHTLDGEGYHIRSLYFDDIDNSALMEKSSGIQVRKKYRIRIYNYSHKTIKLEIKEKYGDYTNKLASKISKEEYEKIISSDISSLAFSNDNVKEKYYSEIRNKLLKPKVIVDYHREAYILPYNDIRITFDKNLSAARPCQNIFTDKLYSKRLPEDYSLIMEIKYNNFLPGHIKKMLEAYSLTRLSVSKYLLCRQELFNQGSDL